MVFAVPIILSETSEKISTHECYRVPTQFTVIKKGMEATKSIKTYWKTSKADSDKIEPNF